MRNNRQTIKSAEVIYAKYGLIILNTLSVFFDALKRKDIFLKLEFKIKSKRRLVIKSFAFKI